MDQDVLQINTRRHEDVTIVGLSGELDSMNVAELVGAFNGFLGRSERLFVLDLSSLEFIDSAGLGGLVTIWETALQKGAFIALGTISPRVHDVLQITGLHTVLQAYPSVDDAVEAVRSMMQAFPEKN